MQAVAEKVERLESLLGQFIVNTDIALNRLEQQSSRTDEKINNLTEKINNLTENVNKLEEQVRKTDKELKEFIEESKAFRAEMKADRKEMNKQWAALAQKMGTLDEDLVAPATRPVLGKHFNCEPKTRAIRVQRCMNGEDFEVDVLVESDDKVFMIEVKSTPKVAYVDEILEKAEQFRKFFPEYGDKELIPIFASIIFPENIVKYASRKKLYVMAYREWEYMDIINFDKVAKDQQPTT